MRHAILLALWIATAGALLTTPLQAAHVKVYVLTGQSNSLGTTADPEETDYTPGTDPADAITRFFWSNVWNETTPIGDSSGLITTLQQQQGGAPSPTFWGPEFGFARKMYDEGVTDIMVVKASRGGGGNTYWSKSDGGHMYQHVLDTVATATAELTNAGDTFEISGLLYLQGESDDTYEASVSGVRLAALVDNLRADLPNATNMHTVVGGIAAAGSNRDVVRSQQSDLGATSPIVDYFSNLDLAGGLYDGLHFDKPSKLIVGERYAEAFLYGIPERPPRPGHVDGGPVIDGGTTPYAWYRADGGVVTYSAGSDQAACWRDESGNDRHLEASGDPQLVHGGIDARPSVTFDGIGDFFDSPPAEWGVADAGTVFSVWKRTASLDPRTVLYDSAALGERQYFFDWDGEQFLVGGSVADGANHLAVLNDTIGAEEWVVVSVTHTTGSTDTVRINGEVVYTGDLLSDGMNGLRIGEYVKLGYAWEGDVSELIVFEGDLPADEHQAITCELMLRWGVTPSPGDANADGQVNAADARILAEHWLTPTDAAWTVGDYNTDGLVDDLDASILASNWTGSSEGNAQVPEPSALVALVGLALCTLDLQQRNRK
ncbi:MAG: hypothetical protein JW818_20965 [Pirellulales bacterium]|nr:hypothetical protein [Pirellulales bacterium]